MLTRSWAISIGSALTLDFGQALAAQRATSQADPALDRLALIVRGADTARHDLTPESAGLHAISLGLSANFPDDHAMLEHGMVIYNALYTWCRELQHEVHNWTLAASATGREARP
jgi:type VI protein secretion system component VasF